MTWLSKHTTFSAAFILIVVLHICYFPFIWGNKTLLAGSRGVPSVMPNGALYGGAEGPAIYRGNDMGASAWVMEADAPLVRHQYLREKAVPLWNPYQAYGAPLAANMQSQPFYPLYVLFALNPGPRTYNLFVLCRLLIAGLGAYLFLRLFLPFTASLAGGMVCMLSGYHVMFFNMPHLSVDVLLPALFFTTERLLRRQRIRDALLAVLVIFLIIAGGMPETTLLILCFGVAYFLFRVLTDPGLRFAARRLVTHFAFVNLIALALGAFFLAPFAEFLRISFDMHQVRNLDHISGLDHDPFGLSIFTYVVPLMFGTAWSTIAPNLGGYAALRDFFGVLPVLLVLFAVTGLRDRRRRGLILFFTGAVAIVLLKRYGAPLVNWIGYLPFFQVVRFQKYEEPLLAFAVSVLCAFGLDQLLSGHMSRRRLVICLGLAFLVLAVIMGYSLPAVLAAKAVPHLYYLSLGGAAAVLFAATLLLLGSSDASRVRGPALLALLTVQLAGQYIYPVYYFMTRSAADEADPYRGAPYIHFLQTNLAHERVFGRDGILYPNWAGAFQLSDIRGLDAVYYWKYLRFVRSFLRDEIPDTPGGDLVERFTGGNEHTFGTARKRRLLQLSSVRYLLSMRPFASDSPMVQEILEQNTGRLAPGREKLVEARQFNIGGQSKTVLYEHPPYDRLPFAMEVTPASQHLLFNIAMDPAVYDGSQPQCGDGVEFRLEARSRDGRIARLYSRYIDPKHNSAERKWIDGAADLSSYVGQRIELLFTTTPGPKGDTCMDWAGWGDPHFETMAASPPVFNLVYDREIKIYEQPDRLPRAALYSDAEIVPDDAAALAQLAALDLDIFRTAVVSAQNLDSADTPALARLKASPAERVRGASIVNYKSQEVLIAADVERPALLVLNDSDYPGWKVYVDGAPSHWITANYLFRGVLLQPGHHSVRFAYEPASFRAGTAVSITALLCLAGFVTWRRRTSGVAETHLVP